MAINTTETQRRYYLFRHTGSGDNIEWLSSTSSEYYGYSPRMEHSSLESNKEYLVKCVAQSGEFFDVNGKPLNGFMLLVQLM